MFLIFFTYKLIVNCKRKLTGTSDYPILITFWPVDFVKLSKNEKYRVLLQFYDEDSVEQKVYLTLFDKTSEEQALSSKLQQEYSPEFVVMVSQPSDLKVGDKLEALYDLDQKWYRASVTKLLADRVQVYFLDYGNSESILNAEIRTKLRFRKCYKNGEEEGIFSLDYQALKCVYANTKSSFADKLLDTEDFVENGFSVKVKEISADGSEFLIYRIVFASEDIEVAPKEIEIPAHVAASLDLEVEETFSSRHGESKFVVPELCSIFTLPNAVYNTELERNRDYKVSISHIVGITEFYVQSPDNLKDLMDHQERIQDLAEENKKTPTGSDCFRVGDFVLVNYLVDQCWYRGLITALNGHLCNVYFVDYGNTESDLDTRELRSTASLYELFSKTNNEANKRNLDMVLEFPFMAICCQLQHKKESTRNTEVLKTLMSDCFSFSIKIQEVTTQRFDGIDEIIKKNIVNLYSDEKPLDTNFEDDIQLQAAPNTPPVIGKEKAARKVVKFEIGSVHEYAVASFEGIDELYLHQMWQVDILNILQAKINEQEAIDSYRAVSSVEKGDAVLAKFYEEDRQSFSWYRAVVLGVTAKEIAIFFTDYGNVDETLAYADLKELPDEFSFEVYPPYAHHVRLNKVKPCIEEHGELLGEFLTSEGYHFKIIDNADEVNGETLYTVELWNNDMKKCLNSQIDPGYELVVNIEAEPTENVHEVHEMKILKASLDSLASELEAKELNISTEYIYIENFQKPFYFCLKKDMQKREELKQSLNEFYGVEREDLKNPQLDDFCAIQFEDSWYRAQFKKLDSNQMYLFYLDFGFEEVYDQKSVSAKVLDKQFYDHPSYVFGACLLDADLKKAIDLDTDTTKLSSFDETFEKFFSVNSREHTLKIHTRLTTDSPSELFVEGVAYYGVQIFNSDNECLNEMILAAKEKHMKKTEKPARPELIRLTAADMPKQSTDTQVAEGDIFRIFSRRIDLFYVFEESKVKRIQNHVKDAVDQLLEEQTNCTLDQKQEEGFFNTGDLVFGRIEDDQAWYRCLITNRNKTFTKYELFFIDFGNTEIVLKSDILCGWDEKHISVFRTYEPQAFQCKLYGLQSIKASETFDEPENKAFREHIKNKLFKVSFVNRVKLQEKSVFEIVLNEVNNNEESVDKYLVSNKLATYIPIPREPDQKEVIEFWIRHLQSLPSSKQFL